MKDKSLMRIFVAGIALILVGIGFFAFTLVRLIGGAALDPQSKVPGSLSAEIEVPGRYYVWDNHWTMFDGQRVKYPAGWPAEAQIAVRDGNGAQLAFVADASQNWSIGNNAKTSVGFIDVPAATAIQIDISDIGRERIVTISNRTMKQELWSRLGGFGIGLAVSAVGAAVCVFGWLRRRRATSAGIESKLESIG